MAPGQKLSRLYRRTAVDDREALLRNHPVAVTEIARAPGNPVRRAMPRQIAHSEEPPCRVLERTLPVSKPTVSHHAGVLAQAGLIRTAERGRTVSCSLCPEVGRAFVDEFTGLTGLPPARRTRDRGAGSSGTVQPTGTDALSTAGPLTW
jgi:DNA-binding transcriptional ArsR family regulator